MVVWGVYRIGAGEMSMGGLIGCNILVGRIMAPLLQLASLLTRLQNSRVSLKALNALMAEVNAEIKFCITGERPSTCTHDCSTCGGCSH